MHIRRTGKPVGSFELFRRKSGFYLRKFSHVDDFEKTLKDGPFFFDSILILLQEWRLGFRFIKQVPSWLPIRVCLPELDLELRGIETISAIASVLGSPIEMVGSKKESTHIFVEMCASSLFPNCMAIDMFNGTILDVCVCVRYKYCLPQCGLCNMFGHDMLVADPILKEVGWLKHWLELNLSM